jgi:hypothetical protein
MLLPLLLVLLLLLFPFLLLISVYGCDIASVVSVACEIYLSTVMSVMLVRLSWTYRSTGVK